MNNLVLSVLSSNVLILAMVFISLSTTMSEGKTLREFLYEDRPVKVESLEAPNLEWKKIEASSRNIPVKRTNLVVFFNKYCDVEVNKCKGYLELKVSIDVEHTQLLESIEVSVQDYEPSVYNAITIHKRQTEEHFDFYIEFFMTRQDLPCQARIYIYHGHYQTYPAVCGKEKEFENWSYNGEITQWTFLRWLLKLWKIILKILKQIETVIFGAR